MRARSTLFSVPVIAAIAIAVASSFASRADAQPKPAPGATGAGAAKKADKPPAPMDVKNAVKKIASGEEARIRSGLDEVRIGGPSAAAASPAVAEALGKGLPLGLTLAAIDTLGELESDAGSAALAKYAVHRDVKVRRAAIKALTRTKGAPASAAFRRALSDQDPVVRGTAASGLGTIKAKDAVPDLFLALGHRVNEAAASIGQLCAADDCLKLTDQLGKLPFDVVTSGLDPVLFRPAAEVTDDTKVKVIGRIRELGTIEANKFLKDVQKRWPTTSSARTRQAIDQAVLATSGGAQ